MIPPYSMKMRDGIGYSIRRYYVDQFLTDYKDAFSQANSILDIGGVRGKKRGQFNLEDHSKNITVLNIDDNKGADIVCDAVSIPVSPESFDTVICSEVLEHVPDPEKIISEIDRVLSVKGRAYITAPFMFPIHADPYDFRRYTASCWKHMLEKTNLKIIDIIPQGSFGDILCDIIRMWIYQKSNNKFVKYGLYTMLRPFIKLAMRQSSITKDSFYNSFTTGYGVLVEKK